MIARERDSILFGTRENERIVDERWGEHFDVVWSAIEETCAAIKNCSESIAHLDNDERYMTLSLMLANILSDIISAAFSVRQGFFRPPAVALRAALENLAAVVVFHDNAAEFQKFKEEKYDVPKAIGKAKKWFPEFGQLYGFGSNVFAHEQYSSVGRAIGKKGDQNELIIVPSLSDELRKESAMLIIKLSWYANLTGKVAEWCFSDYLKEFIFWTPVNRGKNLKEVRTPAKVKAMAFIGKFETLIEKSRLFATDIGATPGD